jgi:hypothetical protein
MIFPSKKDNVFFIDSTLIAGASEIYYLCSTTGIDKNPVYVEINPASGASVTVQYTVSNPNDVLESTAGVLWTAWPNGVVTVASSDTFYGAIVAIKVSTAGNSTRVNITL